MDGGNNACGELFLILSGENCQGHPGLDPLMIIPVNLLALIEVQLIVAHVPNDANNLRPFVPRMHPKPSADCTLIRPDKTSEPLIDNAHARADRRVRFFEETALKQRYSQHSKVIRRSGSPVEAAGC